MIGIDLFAGAGGLSTGFEKAGFEFVLANELDTDISKTYMANHPQTLMINRDIKEICVDFDNCLKTSYAEQNLTTSIDEINKKLSQVDIVIGGPPCQGFSMAGARIRSGGEFIEDERNYLFNYYFRIIQRFEPKYFVFENVEGLTTLQGGAILEEIISIFEHPGNFKNGAYHMSYKVLTSSDFGVPQARNRLIIIGCKDQTIDIDVAIQKAKEQMIIKEPHRFDKVTLKDAISDLSYLNSGEGDFVQAYTTKPKSLYQRKRRSGANLLYNHKASNHSETALARMKQIDPGENYLKLQETINSVHSGSYGRLSWNELANTITTRFDTPSGGRVTHPELHRTLTPREAARIQSFDDSYQFLGNKTSIGKQIGNAVPPLMAEVIAQMILYIDNQQ